MRVFLVFLFIAFMISAGLTFFVLTEKEKEIDPVHKQYEQVFSEFAKNAEDVYNQYKTYGLEILQNHRVEGLRVLKQYGHLIESLQPYMDAEALFSICREHGTQLETLLKQFQPMVIAEVYKRFGRDGLRYMLDDPEVYFLLMKYGDRLVQLANAKGPIVFALVRKHQPEFIELYYDDALFKAISRFGVDGLMAVKTYRGMATTIFNLFADDNRFDVVLRKYGYQQVIPILYYFYQLQNEPPTLKEHLLKFDIYELFQQKTEGSAESPISEKPDQITIAHKQFDRASWALSQIYELGNTFFRQFEISENGDVSPLQIVSMTNMLEDLFIGGLRGEAAKIPSTPPLQKKGGMDSGSLQKGETDSGALQKGETGSVCEQLRAALDILGLLPPETLFSKQARCLYLRAGLAAVTSSEGIEGLLTLEEHKDLVARYGESVIPFVTQYGREGIQLLQQTDGKILQFALIYGQDIVHFAIKYGPNVLDLVNQFGDQMVDAIRKTDGEVIPYVQKYGKDVFRVLEQPEGKDMFALGPVFGEEILLYAVRYPDNFRRDLLKYGDWAVKALQEHGNLAVATARKYGDDVLLYIGLYGDDAVRMVKTGRIGITLLRVIPDDLGEKHGKQLLQRSLPGIYWYVLTRHPRTFNTYLGLLGEETFSLAPYYLQLAFWTLAVLIILYGVRMVSKIIKYYRR